MRRKIVGVLMVAAIVCGLYYLHIASESGSSTQFQLIDPEKTAILRPVVYYNLPNGSVIEVKDKNPFPFTIELAADFEDKLPETIKVYGYEIYRKSEEVFRIAKSFGVPADKLYYNEITQAYLYHDDSMSFEYYTSTGYFRVVFKAPKAENASVFGLLDYEHREIKKSGGVFFARTFDGYSSNIGVLVKSDESGVKSIEGLLLKDVKSKGMYRVLPLRAIPEKLAERVRGDVKANDWYLSNIAFTKLTITNISLIYTITPDGILPVYELHGKYELDYGGIRDSGEVYGRVIAVGEKL
jgi:hypothetical protein